MNSWALIQQGVRDTERLIGQKQYNLSMIKARQTLEYMVKHLAKRNSISDADLMDLIDELYQKNVISKATCEHYHKIRIIGNKAAHDEDNNAYNANTAYHLLSQEVYVFANDYSTRRRRAQTSSAGSRRKAESETSFSAYTLLKILIPVLAVILVIALVRMIHPGDKKTTTAASSAAITTTAAAATTAAPTTTAAETTAAAKVYKTTTSLNVRSAPSKDGDKLATLPAGTVLEYVSAYNDEWAVINYNGGQAYVASQFITSEQVSPSSDASKESAKETSKAAAKETSKAAAKETSKAAVKETSKAAATETSKAANR